MLIILSGLGKTQPGGGGVAQEAHKGSVAPDQLPGGHRIHDIIDCNVRTYLNLLELIYHSAENHSRTCSNVCYFISGRALLRVQC